MQNLTRRSLFGIFAAALSSAILAGQAVADCSTSVALSPDRVGLLYQAAEGKLEDIFGTEAIYVKSFELAEAQDFYAKMAPTGQTYTEAHDTLTWLVNSGTVRVTESYRYIG